jgi:hypothetical protein
VEEEEGEGGQELAGQEHAVAGPNTPDAERRPRRQSRNTKAQNARRAAAARPPAAPASDQVASTEAAAAPSDGVRHIRNPKRRALAEAIQEVS